MEYVSRELELADSQDLFRSDANSDRYGLITQAANPQTNPDGLPVEAKWAVADGHERRAYLLTCAARHKRTAVLQGTEKFASTAARQHVDFVSYIAALNVRCRRPRDAAKFDALPRGLRSSPEAKADLRKRVEGAAQPLFYPCRWAPPRRSVANGCHQRHRQSFDVIEPNIPENNFTAGADQASISGMRQAGRNGAAAGPDQPQSPR